MEKQRRSKIPPVRHLSYKRGDLILKEGDYGISIYELISGRVGIYVSSGDQEINLAVLEAGEIIGEMTFLTGSTAPRSASARALEDTKIAAWHPAALSQEYARMPPILKLVADQALSRLLQTNKRISELNRKLKKVESPGQRSFYRKKLDIECSYRPIRSSEKIRLWGRIRDISKSGVGMTVNSSNTLDYTHQPGDRFALSIVIAPGKRVDAIGQIVNVQKIPNSSQLSLGFSFVRLSEEAQKQLGFFLMP
jgi:CRP-like cAMP-binding protein